MAHADADKRKQYAAKHYRENAATYKRYAREWKARNPYSRYGLSAEAVGALRESQNNRCRICSDSFDAVRMNVDHDHISGRIRGLLCDFCNRGLGHFRDSVDRLQAAIDYLKV
jgi:hypothetical protein